MSTTSSYGRIDVPSSAKFLTRCHAMEYGAEVRSDGEVRFRIWAPSATANLSEDRRALGIHPAESAARWMA